jgi:hypothetical protein
MLMGSRRGLVTPLLAIAASCEPSGAGEPVEPAPCLAGIIGNPEAAAVAEFEVTFLSGAAEFPYCADQRMVSITWRNATTGDEGAASVYPMCVPLFNIARYDFAASPRLRPGENRVTVRATGNLSGDEPQSGCVLVHCDPCSELPPLPDAGLPDTGPPDASVPDAAP